MSLLLVRHGQASYGAADYDNLSERGQLQSRRLGEWLARGGHTFKAVVVGGMRRHRQTADAVLSGAGWDLGDPVTDPGWDEYDHVQLLDVYGVDPVRFWCARAVSFGQDGAASIVGVHERYERELGNDLGNLLSRTTAMVARYRGGRLRALPSPEGAVAAVHAVEGEAADDADVGVALDDRDGGASLDDLVDEAGVERRTQSSPSGPACTAIGVIAG